VLDDGTRHLPRQERKADVLTQEVTMGLFGDKPNPNEDYTNIGDLVRRQAELEEIARRQKHAAAQCAMNIPSGIVPPGGIGFVGSAYDGYQPDHYLYTRLRMNEHQLRAKGVDLRNVTRLTDRVAVIFVHNDAVEVLYDDIDLYPSDKLITQLRLLFK
jgi:hypothetical protein